jgi:hypothetical protein
MTFVHPLLLGGLFLIGVPVLIHLIMQQKPKRLVFPAFRFLVQKQRTNQRRLRLRHLLLLLLRMALIALLCLALARPTIFNQGIAGLVGDRPVAVALVIDTSMSMEYAEGGKTRLEDAQRRARELIDDLPDNSRIAVFDSADLAGGEWLPTRALVQERVAGLTLKPGNGPVTDVVAQAYRLLNGLDDEPDQQTEPLPRFLYVFSDRMEACWDSSRLVQLQELRDRGKVKALAAFVDVGVPAPIDLAITELKLPRQRIPANGRFVVHANVYATGKDYPEVEVRCFLDGEKTPQRQVVKLRAGQNEWVTFERRGLEKGLHQAEVSLATTDNLPFDNARYVTFEVTSARKVLTITDDPENAAIWKLALKAGEQTGEPAFDCEVKATRDANDMAEADLARYQAICLLSVAAPEAGLWKKLRAYVESGGGLAIIPGGEELEPKKYAQGEAKFLMPGDFGKVIRHPEEKGFPWKDGQYQGPVKEWFETWKNAVEAVDFLRPPATATSYWEIIGAEPERAFILSVYDDKERRPALLERKFDRQKISGRVLLLTTAFDAAHSTPPARWHDYLQSSFYLTLAKKVVGYLSGDLDDGFFNHLCRPQQPVLVTLPPEGRFPHYVLHGPGLVGQAGLIARGEGQNELRLGQAVLPGNYTLTSDDEKWKTGFSLNVPSEECRLTPVPSAQIEALFGPDSVLPIGHNINFREALQGHWNQPVELLPWLMILLLLVLAVENLLANKFYRRVPQEAAETAKEKVAA